MSSRLLLSAPLKSKTRTAILEIVYGKWDKSYPLTPEQSLIHLGKESVFPTSVKTPLTDPRLVLKEEYISISEKIVSLCILRQTQADITVRDITIENDGIRASVILWREAATTPLVMGQITAITHLRVGKNDAYGKKLNSTAYTIVSDINQSGFKPAHSMETALFAVTERLYAARSAKPSSVLILLDLSADFDTVNHKILLSALTDLGITGTAWKWFESYLEDCHYQVCNRVSACLTDISSWMTAHHLKLSPSKTERLFIPSTTGPHRKLAISFGNSLITPTEDARSLGVTLDGQLSFSPHIANLTRSCRFLLYNIPLQPLLSQEGTQLLVLAPRWWNELPLSVRTAESLSD
ncbi:hypothetical protein NFI96_018661 [Prochilodus magdalenae]|nr:hypothetical protein NFI96_018661 [Prochilodus magdalenae]